MAMEKYADPHDIGTLRESVEMYRLAGALNPLEHKVHRNLAIANQNLGQKELALQHVQRALELGHSEELSLRIVLVEALGTAGQRAEALATARRSLALLNTLSTSVGSSGGTAVRSSSSFASFYYALASTMASVGGSAEELEGTFKLAFSLAQGTRPGGSDALAELRLGQLNAGTVTAGGEESAIACRVAFQLAMGAGKQQRWREAAMWLREALRVPRALSQQHTTKARKMLPEAEARAAHTAPRDEIAAEAAGINAAYRRHSNCHLRSFQVRASAHDERRMLKRRGTEQRSNVLPQHMAGNDDSALERQTFHWFMVGKFTYDCLTKLRCNRGHLFCTNVASSASSNDTRTPR